jgi:hypothetical protein
VAEFDSDWCWVFCLLGERNNTHAHTLTHTNRNGQGAFFLGPDTPCWLYQAGFFSAVRYN